MSLEEIRKSIDKEAKRRADSIKDEGAAEAAAIIKAAKASAAELVKSAHMEAEKEAARVKNEQISGAQMEISTMLVNARESVIERHTEQLKKTVAMQFSGKMMEKLINAAVKQFGRFAAKDDMVIRAGKHDIELVKRLGYGYVAGADDQLLVESKDGSISIDASPCGMAERHLAEARALLASRLWKVKE
jgi:vacuolar-type H+-ATPase subunit E/Vma4